MRVLITGGAGFAGSHLADHLLEQGHEVAVLVREGEKSSNVLHALDRLTVMRADIRDGRKLQEFLGEWKPQRIYHLAAFSSSEASLNNPKLTYEVNFGGTLNLLLAWRRVQLAEARLLIVSTSEVYGPVGEGDLPIRESSALRPTTPYAGSKTAAEMLAIQFFRGYGVPIIRVRPFNHTGPRQSPEFVCSNFARQIAGIELGIHARRVCTGNIHAKRDFTDVRDMVRGYELLLERGVPGEVYHLCSGRAVSIEEILQTLISMVRGSVEIVQDKSKFRARDNPAIWGDYSKAKEAVGWTPQLSLENTLRDLKLFWEREIMSHIQDKGTED